MLNEAKKELKKDMKDKSLHYMVKIDRLMKFKQLIGASERDVALIAGISKSEVNRMSKIYRLPYKARIYAVKMKVDKHALYEIAKLDEQDSVLKLLYSGKIKTRRDVWRTIC